MSKDRYRVYVMNKWDDGAPITGRWHLYYRKTRADVRDIIKTVRANGNDAYAFRPLNKGGGPVK